jgi:integrase
MCGSGSRNLHAGDAIVLVRVGASIRRETSCPDDGKNIWRLCKLYGRMIGYPMLKPHDLRHGVAMEVLEQRHDLEQVRALLGHARIDTTQIYTMIRPAQLKQAVSLYEEPARLMLAGFEGDEKSVFEEHTHVPQSRSLKLQ